MYSKTLQTVSTEIHELVRLRIFSFKGQTKKLRRIKKKKNLEWVLK